MRQLERTRSEREARISLLMRQDSELKDTLEKVMKQDYSMSVGLVICLLQVEAYNISLGHDKSNLVSRLASMESERASANTEKIELRAEIDRLKDEIDALDDERNALEVTITSLNEKLNVVTVEKEKVNILLFCLFYK